MTESQENAAVRPDLVLDLQGPAGNVFVVLGALKEALVMMHGEVEGSCIARDLWEEIQGHTYEEVLAMVNRHVRLVDSSGLYPQYAVPVQFSSGVEDTIRDLLVTALLAEHPETKQYHLWDLAARLRIDLSDEWSLGDDRDPRPMKPGPGSQVPCDFPTDADQGSDPDAFAAEFDQ